MGFSLEDKEQHRCSCWSAGGRVTDALVVVSSENPDVLAASHHVCVIYLLTVD